MGAIGGGLQPNSSHTSITALYYSQIAHFTYLLSFLLSTEPPDDFMSNAPPLPLSHPLRWTPHNPGLEDKCLTYDERYREAKKVDRCSFRCCCRTFACSVAQEYSMGHMRADVTLYQLLMWDTGTRSGTLTRSSHRQSMLCSSNCIPLSTSRQGNTLLVHAIRLISLCRW